MRIIEAVRIQIQPLPEWVDSQISSDGGVVVPVEIIVQPGFGIEVLACEPQVIGDILRADLAIAE